MKRLQRLCRERDLEESWFPAKCVAEFEHLGLGNHIDGHEIQGHWYGHFVRFLYACADAMLELTEDPWDNRIEMEEERGFKFMIFFFRDGGENRVVADCVPMVVKRLVLERDGESHLLPDEESVFGSKLAADPTRIRG